MGIQIHKLYGAEAAPYFEALVALKRFTFAPFPFLYLGSLEAERAWFDTYLRSDHSFILLLEDQNNIVGACTGITGKDEDENYRRPFLQRGLDPDKIFFYGESMILPAYRSLGYGQLFYEERESYALRLSGIDTLAACILRRSDDHPLAPTDFAKRRQSYEGIWSSRGFNPVPGLTAAASWCDQGSDVTTTKTYQIWLKSLAERRRGLVSAS